MNVLGLGWFDDAFVLPHQVIFGSCDFKLK